MKKQKLQNNFTTPEQSKRLLELGVPADSADCYFYDWDLKDTDIHSRGRAPQIFDWFERDIKKFERRNCIEMYPCWSAARLIEIFSKCYTGAKCYYSPRNLYKTGFWIERFNRLTIIGFIDFSKL